MAPKSPSHCIFCGNGYLCKEHLWPKWASHLIKGPVTARGPMRSETYSKMNWQKRSMMPVHRKERPGPAKSAKMRVVCKHCNSGWMSRIENSIKPILTPMIKGLHSKLDISDQEKIAKWISLRILIGEQTTPSPITSQVDRRSFMTNPYPLKGLKIWTAKCGALTWQSAFHRYSARLDTEPVDPVIANRSNNVQSVAMGIGSVFFYANHTIASFNIDTEFYGNPRILQLWPIVNGPMIWPPPRGSS
jgi:hypothetical protein